MYFDKNLPLFQIFNINIENLPTELPLQQWYTRLVKKNYIQINEIDVEKMLIQKIFINIGFNKAIDLLKDNPLCGLYDGSILKKICSKEFDDLIEEHILLDILKEIKTELSKETYDEIYDINVIRDYVNTRLNNIK